MRKIGTAPISAVILTFNNVAVIERTLRSVAFCREIVVVDSGSTDGTVALSRARGAVVYHRPLDRFDAQRNYGARQAAGQVTLTNHFLGAPIRYRSGPSGFGAKLYRKTAAHFDGAVHERLVIEGRVETLQHPIASYCQTSLKSVVTSYNFYTDKEVEGKLAEVGYWDLIYPPVRRLIGHLFVLGAIREGKRGFIKAMLDSFYVFLLAAKRWEKSLP